MKSRGIWNALAVAALLCLPMVGSAQGPYIIRSAGGGTSSVFAVDSATTAVATSGTVLEALQTVTLPANSLLAVGDFVTLETQFLAAANGNTKVLRQYYASISGTQLATLSTAGNATPFSFITVCRRTSTTTAFCSGWYTWTSGTVPATVGAPVALTSVDFTAPINFVAAGLTSTAAGDVTAVATTLLVTRF